jgi:hypothetical protein
MILPRQSSTPRRLTLHSTLRGLEHQRRDDTAVQPSSAEPHQQDISEPGESHPPLSRDDAPEGLHHAHAALAGIQLLAGLDDVEGVQKL